MSLFGPPDVGKLKAKGDIKGLVKALGYQKDREVRCSAAEALGQIAHAQRICSVAAEPLLAALKDPEPAVRRYGAVALLQGGETTIPFSRAWALKRKTAAQALGEIGDQSTIAPLVEAALDYTGYPWLNNPVGTECAQAMIEALRRIGATELFLTKLGELGWDDSGLEKDGEEVVRVLQLNGDPRAVEPLLELLLRLRQAANARHHEEDQALVIWTLGVIGDARAVEPLRALRALKNRSFDDSRNLAEDASLRVDKALSALGDVDVKALIDELFGQWRNRQPKAKRIAEIGELWNIRDQRVIDALIRCAMGGREQEDADACSAAATALRRMGDTRIVAPVVAKLGSERVSMEWFDEGKGILLGILQSSPQHLAPEDLQALAGLEDGRRLVGESRRDSLTDGWDNYDTIVPVEFARIRRLAQEELAKRGQASEEDERPSGPVPAPLPIAPLSDP